MQICVSKRYYFHSRKHTNTIPLSQGDMMTLLGKQGKVVTAQTKQEIRSLHYSTEMEKAKHFTLQNITVLRSTTLSQVTE